MANQNIIDEYLVRLGFDKFDSVGYARFQHTLQDVAALVDNKYLSMAKSVFNFQVGVTGALAAVGLAAVGIADKTAMADQEYRLLALHMYTSLPVARELKVALDALGQPLENIMWDPELAGRFHQLVKDQQTMTKELGPDFENQMLKIRDVRFEFTRFGVELQYLTMLVVEDLAKAFGTSIYGLLEKMRHFNAWFIDNIPFFADWIARHLVPVLKEVWQVLKDTWGLLELIGGQLKGIDWVAFIGDIGKALIASIQLEQNIVLLFAAANAARKGNLAEAMNDLKSMQQVTGKNFSDSSESNPLEGAGRGLAKPAAIQEAIIFQAKRLGVDPNFALSIAAQESGGGDVNAITQFDRAGKVLESSKGALGIGQLMPRTARDLGVDPSDTGENIFGMVKYLKQLLDKYGNEIAAAEHYYGTTGPQGQKYANDVVQRESTINITVNATTNASANDIAEQIEKNFQYSLDIVKRRTQRNLQEFSTYGAY